MAIFIELTDYNLPGLVTGCKIYRSTSTIDINNLPAPIADIPSSAFVTTVGGRLIQYTDDTTTAGVTYYYRHLLYNSRTSQMCAEVVITDTPSTGAGAAALTAGNSNIGYYGTITSANFATFSQLRSQIGISASVNNTYEIPGFIKAMNKGKTIIFPDKSFARGIGSATSSATFAYELFNNNCVYDNASTKVIKIKGQRYRHRFFNGLPVDTNSASASYGCYTGTSAWDVLIGADETEWNRVLLSIYSDASTTRIYPKLSTGLGTFTAITGMGYDSWTTINFNYCGITVAERRYSSGSKYMMRRGVKGYAWTYSIDGAINNSDNTAGLYDTYHPVLEHLPWGT